MRADGIQQNRDLVYLPESNPDISRNNNEESLDDIMVVDDQPQICSYLREILVRQGHRVCVMMDAQQALHLFKQQPDRFKLVITDQTMPGITVEQIVGELHQLQPMLPIIICSGYSSPDSEVLARKIGAAGFVSKPVDVKQLLDLVDLCLNEEDRGEEGWEADS